MPFVTGLGGPAGRGPRAGRPGGNGPGCDGPGGRKPCNLTGPPAEQTPLCWYTVRSITFCSNTWRFVMSLLDMRCCRNRSIKPACDHHEHVVDVQRLFASTYAPTRPCPT
jgi:hypothetical protein